MMGNDSLKKSEKSYDWQGSGIYFWKPRIQDPSIPYAGCFRNRSRFSKDPRSTKNPISNWRSGIRIASSVISGHFPCYENVESHDSLHCGRFGRGSRLGTGEEALGHDGSGGKAPDLRRCGHPHQKGNLTKPYKGAFVKNFLSSNRRMTVTRPSENHPTPARATASRC